MLVPGSHDRLPYLAAQVIRRAFDAYGTRFAAITAEASELFARGDWHEGRRLALERLDLREQCIRGAVACLRDLLGTRSHEKALWIGMHRAFAALIAGRHDAELSQTFFNSVTRRILQTVGVRRGIEFLDDSDDLDPSASRALIFRRYFRVDGSAMLIREILEDLPFADRFADLAGDARVGGALLDEQLHARDLDEEEIVAEVLAPLFYRNKGAYVVARLRAGGVIAPLVLALDHDEPGVRLDAVLARTGPVSVVFSFTRSHFHVRVEQHRALIDFLCSIMPHKPTSDLYASLGYPKHGKTMLFRDLRRHLGESDDRFVRARGTPGLVMEVFTLPSFDFVFKVIRDRFPEPKRVTHEHVRANYRLVARHDRAGRLIDAQQFEQLKFRVERFEPRLLEDLLRECSRSVWLEGDHVVIGHLYTERRLIPLDIYIREVEQHLAERAVIDFGEAVKDLALADIFPGDLLPKNFGITRNQRAVFYDYDEIRPLSECRFRVMPEPRTPEEEMADEPWFAVAEEDVFPEELGRFLGLPGPLREAFVRHHGDLFEVDFWRSAQENNRQGEIADIYPYGPEFRLPDRR